MRKFGLSLAVAALAALTATAESHAEEWTAYTYIPSTKFAPGAGFVRIVERINAETDGELELNGLLGGQLPIKGSNIVQSVADNIIQIGLTGSFAGDVPIAGMTRLPMLATNREDFDKVMEVVRPDVEAGFDRLGVVAIAFHTWAPSTVFSANPIESLDDIAGQKVRLTGPEPSALIKSFGASPITLPTADVGPALQQGLIDGVVTTSAGGGNLWREQLSHNLRLEMYVADGWIIVNKDAWEGLDPEVREKVHAIIQEEAAAISEAAMSDDSAARQSQEEKGMTMVEVSNEETAKVRELARVTWSDWADRVGSDADARLNEALQALGQSPLD